MAKSGPPGNIPTPPPQPLSGGGPRKPAPPGKLGAGGLKKLADLKESERAEWVDSASGLNLGKLKIAYFPDDPALLAKLSVASANAGKLISDDDSQKNIVATLLQSTIKAQFVELFKLAETDPEGVAAVCKLIDAKVRNWKNGASGLNDCHQFLSNELPKLQIKAQKKKIAVNLDNDKEYQALQSKKQALKDEYDTLYKRYQSANAEKQSEIFEQLNVVIKKLDAERDAIKSHKGALEDSKEKVRILEKQIAAPEKAKQDAIANLQHKIRILENPSGYTDPDTQLENRKIIQKLQQEIKDEQSHVVGSKDEREANQIALNKARALVDANEAKVARASIFKELLSHPDSWKEVMKSERNKERKGVKRAGAQSFDTKGMYMGENNEKQPKDRQFDARFLDANQLSRLARFFSHYAGEYTISDNESIYELIKAANGVLGINEQLNFDILMDIAEGRIKRKSGEYADYIAMNFLAEESLEIDSNRKPNYNKLLERAENFRNAELNKQRGITVQKSGKYYEHNRSIDLNYLTEAQFENMHKFFATSKDSLRNEEGTIDRAAVTKRVNDVLNNTNLAFEDIIDIAEGHLVRKKQPNANEHFTLLLDVERKGSAPNYDAAVKQRSDYITEMARQRKAAQDAARQKRAAEHEQALAAAQEQATTFIEVAKEEFEKPFKKRIPDYEIDVDDLEEFQLFAGHIEVKLSQQDVSEALKEAVFENLRKMNPNVVLNDSLKSHVSSSETEQKAPSGIEQKMPSVQKPKTELTHDETALRVVCNILSGIDVKTRYKRADVKKNFAFANYKMFQNQDRAYQIKQLDKAINDAKDTMLGNPAEAFKILELAIHSVKEDMKREKSQSKRKLGDSRLEKVINDLSKEVDAMKGALDKTSEQIVRRKPPNVG